ncbi:YhgE/Pip domain-containing protein [Bacillaceae bacterium W0354]
MKGFKELFKIRKTYMGMAAALMFQVIFFSVWLTAYNGVEERTDQLSIGVVNEDVQTDVLKQLERNLPFDVKKFNTVDEGMEEIERRKIEMLIHLPANFSSSIQEGSQATINYWINEATATSNKSMMEQVAQQMTSELNNKVISKKIQVGADKFIQQLNNLQLEQSINEAIKTTAFMIISAIQPESVESNINRLNAVDTFSANLVPLMVIIASFAGAMVMIMQIQEASELIKKKVPSWSLFLGRQYINIAVSLILPIITFLLLVLFNVDIQVSFITFYLFQSIMYFSFLTFAQVFVYLFGNYGMVFNILALSLQLVTSGVLVSRKLLSNGYYTLAQFLPATYGADSYYSIIFGGNSQELKNNILYLLLFSVIALVIIIIIVFVKDIFLKQSVRIDENEVDVKKYEVN